MKSKKSVSKSRKPKSKPKTVSRRYEGAGRGKRLSRWRAPSTGANSSFAGSITTLRNRARDLRRNNPYAAKGILVISANVVGVGIQTQYRGENASQVSELEAEWVKWAESTAIDFDGLHNIYGMQALVIEAVAESGEVLIRRRVSKRLGFPLQYQVLESDFLDSTKTEVAPGGNYIIQGIEFDSQGRRVAYHLYETHPGEIAEIGLSNTFKSNRIPASEIMHVFRPDRPGQARGITWLAPVMVRLKDLDDYEDAQLMRQKIAACFTAFVQDLSADVTDEDEECDPLAERIEPGLIEMLPPGKTISFSKPPDMLGYNEYVTSVLRGIAAGLGITYESLAGDYSQVNFSSGRMGWLEFGRAIKVWRERIMVTNFLNPIAQDFLKFSSLKGLSTDNVSFVHVAPSREMIDPTKEVPATIDAIKAGLTTLSDEIMSQGRDPQAQLTQYKKDMDNLDALGLKLTSDPRNEHASLGSNGGGVNEETN